MTATLRKAFGRRLVTIRQRQDISQSDLANSCKLQPSAVSHFESGRRLPNLANLVKLADALQVSTDELLGR